MKKKKKFRVIVMACKFCAEPNLELHKSVYGWRLYSRVNGGTRGRVHTCQEYYLCERAASDTPTGSGQSDVSGKL